MSSAVRVPVSALPLIGIFMAPAGAQESAAVELDAIEVVGRRDSDTYIGDETFASKTHLELRKLPQSVWILSRQVIDNLGPTRVDGTLDYVGGISRQNNHGGRWDNFAVRGLPGNENTGSSTLLNGIAGNRGFQAPRDTANVERIEFLKGLAAPRSDAGKRSLRFQSGSVDLARAAHGGHALCTGCVCAGAWRPGRCTAAFRRHPRGPAQSRLLSAGCDSADGRMGATLAVFDIRKKNVLTGDPLNPGNQIAAGNVRSRGRSLICRGSWVNTGGSMRAPLSPMSR